MAVMTSTTARPMIAGDHRRPPVDPVDDHSRRQRQDEVRHRLERGEDAELERTGMQDEDRDQRQGHHRDLGADGRHRLAEPERPNASPVIRADRLVGVSTPRLPRSVAGSRPCGRHPPRAGPAGRADCDRGGRRRSRQPPVRKVEQRLRRWPGPTAGRLPPGTASTASSTDKALRYGRSEVIASKASATATTRAPSGIASPGEAGRVARAVIRLVVVEDDLGTRPEQVELAQDPGPDLGVQPHRHLLLCGQRARLQQDPVRDGDLA